MRLTPPVVASTQFFDRAAFKSAQRTTQQAGAGLTALSTVLTFSGTSPAFVELITLEAQFAAAPLAADVAVIRLLSVDDSAGTSPIEFEALLSDSSFGQLPVTLTFTPFLFVPIGEGFRIEVDATNSSVAVDGSLALYGIVFDPLG